jgi:Transglycosylase SLT domain
VAASKNRLTGIANQLGRGIASCAIAIGVPAFALAEPGSAKFGNCFEQAQKQYGVPADLMRGVAQVESSMNPLAINRSHIHRTGSVDIGLMQINSRHLPALAKWSIGYANLLDACTNVQVGAWLLAGEFTRRGLSWDAVGANNAACTTLKGADCLAARTKYAWKVYQAMQPKTAGAQSDHKTNLSPKIAASQISRIARITAASEDRSELVESTEQTQVQMAQQSDLPQ